MNPAVPSPVDPARVRRKVVWRILPLLLVLYVIAYLDRMNVGFVERAMAADLKFTKSEFGFGFSIFFVGYLLLEIPGALLVEHWSARKWFARILVTWGVCSMAVAFVTATWHFYLARFLLGLAEAGFFPGVLVYLTHWFPRADRSRAMAGFILGVPVSQSLGALSTAYLVDLDWLGYAGWQWVFLIQGAPAVLFGLALPWIMTDRPRQAKWLSPAEQDWLQGTLDAERQQIAAHGGMHLMQAMREPVVLLLALAIFFTNTGGYGFSFWLRSAVSSMLTGGSGDVPAERAVLLWSGVVLLFGIPGVYLSGQSSDRTGERKWHCVFGQVATCFFLLLTSIPGQPWAVQFGWFCCVGFFAVFWPSPFWALPTLTLSASAAAVSLGFINICANVAGIVGPWLFGVLRDPKVDVPEPTILRLLACCYLAGGIVVACLRVRKPDPSLTKPAAEHTSTT